MKNKLVSIVTPFFNEENSINFYFESLEKTLVKIADINFEIIAVDDGSSDKTYAILTKIAAQKNNLKVIKLSRNFGKEAALTAGLDNANGLRFARFARCYFQDDKKMARRLQNSFGTKN